MARTNLTALASSQGARSRNRALAARQETEALINQDAAAREDFASAGLPPDWLSSAAAGAGAGWIFGPVGGVLGMAVTAMLSKNRREGIAAQAASDAKTASTLIEGGEKSLQRLEAAAETDQDRLEVELLRNQYEQSVALAQNPDPRVAIQGFTSLLNIPGLASGEADEIEAAQLDRERLERDQFARESDQAVDLRNRLEQESRTFVDAERQFRNLQELLKGDPTNLDATTAIFTFAKLVNPGEITTEGDIQTLSAGGGVSQALASRLNDVILGRSFLDETIKAEMLEAGKDLMRTQRSEQIQRNQLARDFAEDLGIRPQLIENVLIPLNTKPDQLVPIKQTRSGPPIVDPSSPASQMAEGIVDSTFEFFGSEPPEQTFEFAGQEYRRVDRGEGRFEWEPIPDQSERRQRQTEERMLETPGLFQPGGFFGRDLTDDERRRQDELRQRRRSVNE